MIVIVSAAMLVFMTVVVIMFMTMIVLLLVIVRVFVAATVGLGFHTGDFVLRSPNMHPVPTSGSSPLIQRA